ncbi:MAG TPA: hypothetical protein VKY44_03950 [Flavobacterium sp.]|nr:hypothetical protein [Flavobacterium sp.]
MPIYFVENDETLFKLIYRFNNTFNRDLKTEIVHKIYDLGKYDEIAEALATTIYGQSINFQNYVNTITPNWEYIRTGREEIAARQNKWTIRNLFRIGKKWTTKIHQTFWKPSPTY